MLYYDLLPTIQRWYGDKIPVLAQITSERPSTVNFVAQFCRPTVPIRVADTTEICEGWVDPDGRGDVSG